MSAPQGASFRNQTQTCGVRIFQAFTFQKRLPAGSDGKPQLKNSHIRPWAQTTVLNPQLR